MWFKQSKYVGLPFTGFSIDQQDHISACTLLVIFVSAVTFLFYYTRLETMHKLKFLSGYFQTSA